MELREFKTLSLRDILDVIFKRKSFLLLFFLTVILAVAGGTFLIKPVYEASAQILIKRGRESVFVPAGRDANPVISYNREELINSEIEILKSRSLAEKVVLMMGPTVLYEKLKDSEPGFIASILKRLGDLLASDRKEKLTALQRRTLNLDLATSMFLKNLDIECIKKSNVVRITFKHHDRRLAAMVVNNLVDIYLDEHLAIHKRPESHLFFQEQADHLRDKLHHAEGQLKDLKEKHNITSLEQEREILLTQASALRAERNRTLSQEVETEKRIREYRRQLSAIPKTIAQDEVVDQNQTLINVLEARLVELELEEKELRTKYTDQSRLVQNVREEIRILQEKLAAHKQKSYGRKRSGMNPTYQNLQQELYHNEAELTAIAARSQTQKKQLNEYMQKIAELNQIEVQINHLKNQVEVNRQNYKLYLAKFEESRISDAMDAHKITNVSLIEAASPPIKPVSPRVIVNLLIGIFLGAIGGLGLAFTREFLDDSFRRPEDVEEYLNLPVLASIPKLKL